LRILFVGMPDSVHVTRWINNLSDRDWDLHLFSATAGRPHPELRNITLYNLSFSRPSQLHESVRLRGLWPLRVGVERLSERVSYSTWLARLIRWLKPDIVHSMEIQRAGYMTLEAKAQLKGKFPPWIVTNWGSDIYFFGRLAAHAEKIRAVMAACDYYHCECHRDVSLARQFGFKGENFPVFPVAGGFDLEWMRGLRQPGPTSRRRTIALKGYQTWAGRSLVGLRALELCADVLEGYRVDVYMASPEVKLATELLARSTGIRIESEFKNWSREDILRMHGRARISIGLSISDAISTSLLEAMIMGAFPVQSNTACADEWLRDGETGILVHPEDPAAIAAAIRRAVTDDELVDRAAESNDRLVVERLSYSVIQPKIIEMYRTVASERGLKLPETISHASRRD
jgi:glycosyltransferase involved in cell wall biosynthesis